MDEIVPVVVGAVLGALIWRWSTGGLPTVLNIVTLILSGASPPSPAARFLKAWFTSSWSSARQPFVWPPALPLRTTSAGAVRR